MKALGATNFKHDWFATSLVSHCLWMCLIYTWKSSMSAT